MKKGTKRNFLLSACMLFLYSVNMYAQTNNSKPNVLMISVDDLNDWVGIMGGNPSAITPNIDKLASEGVLFKNAYCQTALCAPSRASVMSSLRPSTSGVYGQINDEYLRASSDVMQRIQFLPEYFSSMGYITLGVGKIFHNHAPNGVFEQSGGRMGGFGPSPQKHMAWNKKGTITDWGAYPDVDEKMPDYKTAQWAITKLKEENYEKPFFMCVGFQRPHVPWHVPQKWFDMHPLKNVQTPPYKMDDKNDLPPVALKVEEMPMMPTTDWAIKSENWKKIVQAYLASTTFVDHYIGQVLAALENSPYKNNTIIILWSDHGYRLGEKGSFSKHNLWQESLNVPLIIKPLHASKGSVVNRPVELLDIYPTLVDLCGLPKNESNEGKSLKPFLNNPKAKVKEAAVSTFGRNNHAITTEQYKYIHYSNGAEELYDRKEDPNEWTNLAHKKSMEKVKKKLQKYLPQHNAPMAKNTVLDHNDHFKNLIDQ